VRWLLSTTLGLSLISATSAAAQPPSGTRADELALEIEQTNRDLNATYQNLMRQLKLADQVKLRVAQRAWLKFRDADCAYGWWDLRDCLIARTSERAEQLRDSHFQGADGKPIKVPPAR